MPDPLSDLYAPELDAMLPGTPQRPSRSELISAQMQRAGEALRTAGTAAREWFMPTQSMRNPDTPELQRAYADALAKAHAAGGGRLPPMPGGEMFDRSQAEVLDLLQDVGPKGLGALKVLGPAAKGATALKGLIGGALHPAWISQRLPTAVKAIEDPLAEPLIIDAAAMKATPKAPQQKQQLWDKNVGVVRDYPNLSHQEKMANSTDSLAENFIRHAVDNLKYIYNKIPENIRARSKLWYEGANSLAQGATELFKHPLQTSAGVYAALSPQKDWFMNVSLGDRVMHIFYNQQNFAFTPEMMQTAQVLFNEPEDTAAIARISQSTLANLQRPDDKAMWLRIYDQTYHDPSYHIISPEGQRLNYATNLDGSNSRIGWGSLAEIGKAIQVLESGGDRAAISRLMGEKHKVRNFYMNILDPHSPTQDVTIDTHAVAAALLRPLAGDNIEVAHNFANYAGKGMPGVSGSSITGVQGTYGLYAEAYRRAAKDLGISPRELQSITWEGVRGLFPDTFKTEANNALIDQIWREGRARGIPVEQIREQIHGLAGGIDAPSWYTPAAAAAARP